MNTLTFLLSQTNLPNKPDGPLLNMHDIVSIRTARVDILALIVAYLIGCFSLSYIISKHKGINLKEQGSKNLGASNTLAIIGKRAGALVLISDMFKVFIAILIGTNLNYLLLDFRALMFEVKYEVVDLWTNNNVTELMIVLFGASAILGHIFPIHLKFKGGKGTASYLATVLALATTNPLILIVPLIAAIVTLITNYIISATFTLIILTPLYMRIIEQNGKAALLLAIVSLIIFIKHIENIRHIKDGSEMKIKEAFKNKYKYQNTEQL